MATYEIPLIPGPQRFATTLAGAAYALSLAWCGPAGCWLLDIATVDGAALVRGIPLVTGTNLLGQFAHLGIGGELWARVEGDADAIPAYGDLGGAARLYWVAP